MSCFIASWGLLLFNGCFFFSSRRRHTRWNCDWSSDVCSSDLLLIVASGLLFGVDYWVRFFVDTRPMIAAILEAPWQGLRSEERRVGKSVDLGGRRIIKKKKTRYRVDS